MKIKISKIQGIDDKVVGFKIELPPNNKGFDVLFIALDQEKWPDVRVGDMPRNYDYTKQQPINNKKTVVCEVELKGR